MFDQGYSKIKNIYKFNLFGRDELLRGVTGSQFASSNTGTITNTKRIRFDLKGVFNNYKLSNSSRLVLEACNLPTITGVTTLYAILRLVCNSEDIIFDSSKIDSGNPIVCVFKNSNSTITNTSPQLYNLHIKDYLFRQNYIEFELEVPTTTAAINFVASNPLDQFYISFYIYDIDEEYTEDRILAPPQISKKLIENKSRQHIA